MSLTVGLIFTGVTVASLIGLHAGKVEVPRLGTWRAAPRILVSSSSTVSVDEVTSALEVLRELGAQVAGVDQVGVIDGPREGAIVIRRREQHAEPGHAGRTHHRIDAGVIRWAEITLPLLDYLPPDLADGESNRPYTREERRLIIAHELAHALGWGHCETALFGRGKKGRPRLGVIGQKTGHLMHPHLDGLGWNTKGMER